VLGSLTLNAAASDMMLPVKSVYDGDTFHSNLCALPVPLSTVSVRIAGIDTPEIRTTCASEKAMGYAAKKYLEDLFVGQTEVLVKNVEWDKYGGRIGGDVFLADGSSVAERMIKSGLARPYTGGTRQSWCE